MEPIEVDQLSYEQASKELEAILQELKADKISIDSLESKVARAAQLAAFCTQKLRTTEAKITEIIQKNGL